MNLHREALLRRIDRPIPPPTSHRLTVRPVPRLPLLVLLFVALVLLLRWPFGPTVSEAEYERRAEWIKEDVTERLGD